MSVVIMEPREDATSNKAPSMRVMTGSYADPINDVPNKGISEAIVVENVPVPAELRTAVVGRNGLLESVMATLLAVRYKSNPDTYYLAFVHPDEPVLNTLATSFIAGKEATRYVQPFMRQTNSYWKKLGKKAPRISINGNADDDAPDYGVVNIRYEKGPSPEQGIKNVIAVPSESGSYAFITEYVPSQKKRRESARPEWYLYWGNSSDFAHMIRLAISGSGLTRYVHKLRKENHSSVRTKEWTKLEDFLAEAATDVLGKSPDFSNPDAQKIAAVMLYHYQSRNPDLSREIVKNVLKTLRVMSESSPESGQGDMLHRLMAALDSMLEEDAITGYNPINCLSE